VRQVNNLMLQKWRLMCFVVINLGYDVDDGEGRRRGRTLRVRTHQQSRVQSSLRESQWVF